MSSLTRHKHVPSSPVVLTEAAPGEHRLVAGQLVGEYEIQGLLAVGGMSSVYSAVHPLIAKRAAVKVMSPKLSHDAEAAARFVLEARAVNQIGHPNIVDVFACGRLDDGRSYLVMEWLDGETLGQRLWRERISFVESCDILLEVCDALEAAHAAGIVHLDIKPDNVFLAARRSGRPTVKLLDFGIAKLLTPGHAEAARDKMVTGTPHYLSPEQAVASPELDHRSDIYSIGAMAYEMFTGAPPFHSTDVDVLLKLHVHCAAPAPDVAWTGAGPKLGKLLLELLSKSPAQRPPLGELRERLQGMRDDSMMVQTQRVDGIAPKVRRARMSALVAVPIMLGLVLAAWLLPLRGRANVTTHSAPPSVFAAGRLQPSVPAVQSAVTTPEPPAPSAGGARTKLRPASSRRAAHVELDGSDYLLDYEGARR